MGTLRRAPSQYPHALLGGRRLVKIAHLDRDLRCPKRKAPAGAGGLGGLGLLIFETKTHPVTAGIMIDERIGSPPYELNWIACILLLLLPSSARRLRIVFGLALRSRAQEDDGTARRSGIGMTAPSWRLFIGPLGYRLCNALLGRQAARPDPAFKASACRMPTPSAHSIGKSQTVVQSVRA
jgi:hypothetical protein